VQTVDSGVQQTEQIMEHKQIDFQEPTPRMVDPGDRRERNLLERFISRIPYTNEFGARIERDQKWLFEARLRKYKTIKSIDSDLKEKLDSEFQFIAAELSNAESGIEAALFYARGLTLTMVFALYVTGPPLVAKFFSSLFGWGLHGFWWWALELFLSVLTGTLAGAILFLPAIAFRSSEQWVYDFFNVDRLRVYWGVMLLTLACGYLYAVYSNRLVARPWPFSHRLSFYLLIQAGFSFPLLFALQMPYRLFLRSLQSRKQRFHARGVIIDQLLNILYDLEDDLEQFDWTKFWYRASLTRQLEVVASCIESHFPRHFLTGAQETDRWVDRSTTEMANGVREMIKWIVAPNANTYEGLKARVIKYFTAALASEWGEFDRVPAQELSPKQSVKDRVTSAVTALLTAAVPVLLLLLLRRLGVVVAEPLLTYLTVGSYIWAALSLLSRLDPQYAAKLGALTDLTKILPLGKTKKIDE
jgi:hypothetical protein